MRSRSTKKRRVLSLILAPAGVLLGLWFLGAGCSSEPTAPERSVALSVALNRLNQVQASLLGAAQNEILYRLDGAGETGFHQVYGPFSTSASTGSVTFTVKVPASSGPQVLSLQLNDASTHQPLAVGAASLDLASGAPGEGGLVVDMGSVTRTCYYTYENLNPGVSNLYYNGSSYSFFQDVLVAGFVGPSALDISFVPLAGGGFYMETNPGNTLTNSIAYLGNGDLVDFDRVPPASQFFQYSYQGKAAAGAGVTLLQTGDIYCVRADNSYKVAGVHAWVQVTDPGTIGATGPSFRFRVNSTLPYFAYEQTSPDVASTCSPNY